MEPGEVTLFLNSALAFFGVCCLVFLLWCKVMAPRIPRCASCSASDQSYVSNSVVNLFPSLVVPGLLVAAGLPSAAPWTDGTQAPTPLALVAVGASCGYLAYDTLFCLYYEDHRTALNFGHHLTSILIWPWAMLNHRGVVFVEYFAFTEITGVLQNLRLFMSKMGYDSSPLYVAVGAGWTLSFFIVRILPVPYFVYLYVYILRYRTYEPTSAVLAWIGTFTVPIPWILNIYWFFLIAKGLAQFLAKYNRRSKEKLAVSLLGADDAAGTTA